MNTDIESAGALATATLAAAELQGDAGKPAATHAHSDARCANCGTPLAGAYCHACGQAGHVHRSLLHIGEELLHGILHFDTRSWRTLPLLVVRPGLLTRRYIDGQRSRYVSPLALFLFSVFLMFFTFSFVGGPSSVTRDRDPEEARKELTKVMEGGRKTVERRTAEMNAAVTPEARGEAMQRLLEAQNDLRMTTIALSALNAGAPAQKTDEAGNRPGPISSGASAALDKTKLDRNYPKITNVLRHALANPELALYKVKSSAYKFAFMLVPISLPFLWLMFFWRPGITFYDHAIFLLYSLSFMSLWFAFIGVLLSTSFTSWIAQLAVFYVPVHIFLQLKETYGVSGLGATWRTFALLFAGFLVFMLFLTMILAISLQ